MLHKHRRQKTERPPPWQLRDLLLRGHYAHGGRPWERTLNAPHIVHQAPSHRRGLHIEQWKPRRLGYEPPATPRRCSGVDQLPAPRQQNSPTFPWLQHVRKTTLASARHFTNRLRSFDQSRRNHPSRPSIVRAPRNQLAPQHHTPLRTNHWSIPYDPSSGRQSHIRTIPRTTNTKASSTPLSNSWISTTISNQHNSLTSMRSRNLGPCSYFVTKFAAKSPLSNSPSRPATKTNIKTTTWQIKTINKTTKKHKWKNEKWKRKKPRQTVESLVSLVSLVVWSNVQMKNSQKETKLNKIK